MVGEVDGREVGGSSYEDETESTKTKGQVQEVESVREKGGEIWGCPFV